MPGDRQAARRLFGIGKELVVLTVARLDDRNGYKGHDKVIRLMPELERRGLPFTYLIAGTGSDRERLSALAIEYGVSDRVRFLGMVADEDLPDLYRAADLFALPSTGEGFGIAFIESMACGTPAIGLSIGGSPDALADGELGTCAGINAFPQEFLKALKSCRSVQSDLPLTVERRFGYNSYSKSVYLKLKSLNR